MMNLRFAVILGLIVVAAATRVAFAGIPNFSPVTAIALFSGAYLADRKLAILVPLLSLLIGDLILGLHNTMLFTYGAFLFVVMLGFWLSRHVCGQLIVATSLISSVMFFAVTNFGVWAMAGYYPMTLDGLVTSYVAAIPFFQNTLMGDLFFTAVLFGFFMLLEPRLSSQKSRSGATA